MEINFKIIYYDFIKEICTSNALYIHQKFIYILYFIYSKYHDCCFC